MYKIVEVEKKGTTIFALANMPNNNRCIFVQKEGVLTIYSLDSRGMCFLRQPFSLNKDGTVQYVSYKVQIPGGWQTFNTLPEVRVIHRPKNTHLMQLVKQNEFV